MKLNKLEQRTFILLLAAAFFNGFVQSGFQMQDIIGKKALDCLDWQVTVLVMLWPLSNLISVFWSKLLQRSRSVAVFFLLIGFVGRLILIAMLWVTDFYSYLMILIVVFSFNSLLSPAQNTIYQTNIRVQNRGALFGYVSSIQTLVMVAAGYIAGKVLDIDEDLFRIIFVVIGLCGFVSALIMALIKSNKQIDDDVPPLTMRSLFRETIGSSLKVLKTNRDFACFERNFFLYGIGYMVVLPAIPKYLVEYLHMDYTHTFLGKVILAQLGVLALSPLAGTLHDKKNPAWFTFVSFGLLSCYPLLLFISSLTIGSGWENGLAYAAFLIFGVAMAGVAVAWNISSIYFAGNRDVSMYQGVHVTLTGMRGIFAPFLGYALLSILDVRATFVLAFILQVTASVLSLKLYKEMEAKRFSTEELIHVTD